MRRLIAAAGLVCLAGCGGGGGGNTTPAPVVTAPTISTATTVVYIGQTVQFSASGTGITWGGDAQSVATVDGPTGRVTGVATGRVTIWAENAGGRTTRALRVLPSFAGNWSGTYAITGCQSTGQIAQVGFCGNFFQGQVLNVQLQFTQTDDRVNGGAYALGGNGPGTFNPATVSEAGVLPISGEWDGPSGSIDIQNARLESASAGTLTGTFDQSWVLNSASGFGIISCVIRNVTRSSGGPTVLLTAPADDAPTFEQMIQRLRR